MTDYPKISFCIVSMNRMHQLKKTLKSNIQNNSNYKNVEFLILDYNSSDNTESWLKDTFAEEVSEGLMTVYRTNQPKVFSQSHSKNLAFKLAMGDIICNVNADHYLGQGFVDYIADQFLKNEKIVLTPFIFSNNATNGNRNHANSYTLFRSNDKYLIPADLGGKVCLKKNDFITVNGFDERMGIYGFEDIDFVTRLFKMGLDVISIKDEKFLGYISHADSERYSAKGLLQGIYNVYINYKTPYLSCLLILYKSGTFEIGEIQDNIAERSSTFTSSYEPFEDFHFSIPGNKWENGKWFFSENGGKINLLTESDENYSLEIRTQDAIQCLVSGDDNVYYCVSDEGLLNELVAFKPVYYNRLLLEENLKSTSLNINPNGFGQGIVYKNFRNDDPINLI